MTFRKYRNAMHGGSKLEESVHEILLMRERAKQISDIQRQQTIVLQDGPRETRITWRIDFSFTEDGKTAYAEAKGMDTPEFKLKLKMFRYRPQGVLYLYRGSYQRPFIAEVIKP